MYFSVSGHNRSDPPQPKQNSQTRYSCFLGKQKRLTILQLFLELLNLPPELGGTGHGFLGALYQPAYAVRMAEAKRFCQLPQRGDSKASSKPRRHVAA